MEWLKRSNTSIKLTLNCGLHPFNSEEGGEVRGEGGEHEDDKEPVGGHEDPPGQRLWRLPAALRGERREREPEALLQGEYAARVRVCLFVVLGYGENGR
jgi:hypothetical protein